MVQSAEIRKYENTLKDTQNAMGAQRWRRSINIFGTCASSIAIGPAPD
jgi:hypothetical protein